MAKKKSAPVAVAPKTKSPAKSPAKTPAKAAPSAAAKKAPAVNHHNGHDDGHVHSEDCECVEIELDAASAGAVEMAQKSKKFSDELDVAVNKAVFQVVRKFYREHGIGLTAAQAENVAIVLFGS